jgi:hypothetical protein
MGVWQVFGIVKSKCIVMKKLVIVCALGLSIGQLKAQHGRWPRHAHTYPQAPRVVVVTPPPHAFCGAGYYTTYTVPRPLINVVIGGGNNNCAPRGHFQQAPTTVKEWVEAHWENTSNGRVWVEGHFVIREVQ